MCEKIEEPVYTDIRIEADMNGRTAKCEAVGVATGRGEPIRNPVTGAEHRVGIVLPNGFEYTRNEVGRGWSQSEGLGGVQAGRQLCPLVRAAFGPKRGRRRSHSTDDEVPECGRFALAICRDKTAHRCWSAGQGVTARARLPASVVTDLMIL